MTWRPTTTLPISKEDPLTHFSTTEIAPWAPSSMSTSNRSKPKLPNTTASGQTRENSRETPLIWEMKQHLESGLATKCPKWITPKSVYRTRVSSTWCCQPSERQKVLSTLLRQWRNSSFGPFLKANSICFAARTATNHRFPSRCWTTVQLWLLLTQPMSLTISRL